MRFEINTLKRNPAVVPDMNACNSCGSKIVRWGKDCVISDLQREANPPSETHSQLV